jgi:hypothetical protein
VAALPQVPHVRGEIGRVQLHQMQVMLTNRDLVMNRWFITVE